MKFLDRIIKTPVSNVLKNTYAAQLWIVKWNAVKSYTGINYFQEPKMEAFFSEGTANEFVASLEAAHKLCRHEFKLNVEIVHQGEYE